MSFHLLDFLLSLKRHADFLPRPIPPPLSLHIGQQSHARTGCRGQKNESSAVGSREIFRDAEYKGQQKTADTADSQNQSRYGAYLFAKSLRHELKDSSVADSESAYSHKQLSDRPGQRRQLADQEHGTGNNPKHRHQDFDTTAAVRQEPAYGPKQAPAEDTERREVPGHDFANTVLVIKKDGKKAGQADKAAERHHVEKTEPPGVIFR